MLTSITIEQSQTIRELFQQADGLLIAAGAGMGVDSGLPDFRGNEGMWKAYPALGRQRVDFTQIANPAAFRRHPKLAWGFYGHRLNMYRQTMPHTGFQILHKLSERFKQGSFVFTSNVDGHFQKAGFADERVYECHGSIHHMQCMQPCEDALWSAEVVSPVVEAYSCQYQGSLPACPHCNGLARPNILMFGDDGWLSLRSDAQEQRLTAWLKQARQPLLIELGAGIAIPTVRMFSEQFAPHLIRINPRDTGLPRQGGLSLAMTALTGLTAIQHALHEK